MEYQMSETRYVYVGCKQPCGCPVASVPVVPGCGVDVAAMMHRGLRVETRTAPVEIRECRCDETEIPNA
jgi:hypothetical protein